MQSVVSRRAFVIGAAALFPLVLSGCDVLDDAHQILSAPSSSGDPREQVVSVMRREIGNTDGTKYEDALLDAGSELCGGERGLWCVTFLWWAFDKAGYGDLFCGGEPIAWPERQVEWWRENGQMHDEFDETDVPQFGDIYYQLLDPEDRFDGCGDVSHGEFVVNYDVDLRKLTCISANPVVEVHEHVIDDELASDHFRGYACPAWDEA